MTQAISALRHDIMSMLPGIASAVGASSACYVEVQRVLSATDDRLNDRGLD